VATYRLSAKLISRGTGRSAIAAAAYRAGQRLVDRQSGLVFDYRRRSDVLDRCILAPDVAPDWVRNREDLWNAVEGAEKRKDAQVAREIQLSLPHELSLDANCSLVLQFVREQFVARGMVADVAIHEAHRGSDERNIHAHILLTTRTIDRDGFGKKDRSWNERALLESWREAWELHVNRRLERERIQGRVDHRSYATRGLDLEPEPKQGPVATKMERMGRTSRAGEDRRAARARNAERQRLHEERELLERQIRNATRQFERPQSRDQGPSETRCGFAFSEPSGAQRWREKVLSDIYETEMKGSRLARFWRIDRVAEGLAFSNARGRFVDRGDAILADTGGAMEIRGMLDLVAAKGWGDDLTITGTDAFKRKAMELALERGFTIRAESRDAELLRSIEQSHTRQIESYEWTR
jgi:hypothetical protein